MPSPGRAARRGFDRERLVVAVQDTESRPQVDHVGRRVEAEAAHAGEQGPSAVIEGEVALTEHREVEGTASDVERALTEVAVHVGQRGAQPDGPTREQLQAMIAGYRLDELEELLVAGMDGVD